MPIPDKLTFSVTQILYLQQSPITLTKFISCKLFIYLENVSCYSKIPNRPMFPSLSLLYYSILRVGHKSTGQAASHLLPS